MSKDEAEEFTDLFGRLFVGCDINLLLSLPCVIRVESSDGSKTAVASAATWGLLAWDTTYRLSLIARLGTLSAGKIGSVSDFRSQHAPDLLLSRRGMSMDFELTVESNLLTCH